jgi:hypothetical protein
MENPRTRLNTKKLRKTLRRIGSLCKSSLPEKTKHKLRIISWIGTRKVEEICAYYEITRSLFYRLLNTFLGEGLKGLMKWPGRFRGSTVPEPAAREIKRVGRQTQDRLQEDQPAPRAVHAPLDGAQVSPETRPSQ